MTIRIGQFEQTICLILISDYEDFTEKNNRISAIILICNSCFDSYLLTGKHYWERIDILSEAIYDIFEPIEATAFTPEEWQSRESLITDFAKNGEVIYE